MNFRNWKCIAAALMLFDAIAVAFSYAFGLWMRFDFAFSVIPSGLYSAYVHFLPIYVLLVLVVFWVLRLYHAVWRFVSFHEVLRYACVSGALAVVHGLGIRLFFTRMPFSYYIVGGVMQTILIVSIRLSYRVYVDLCEKRQLADSAQQATNVMIIGAGAAGQMVVRELLHSDKLQEKPCCIIDDNSNKWGRFVEDVPVVGGKASIQANVEKYHIEQIYFCIPSADAQTRKEILSCCAETGCKLKSLPGLYQLANDEVLVSRLKPVAVEDLLGREPIRAEMGEIFAQIEGKVILVTGGGGSIGSELCRQIAAHSPRQLIIFDVYENTTYGIELELRDKFPGLNLTVLIGSVRDSRRLNQIFETYHPEMVYHAAAHKHVPLMEHSPNEAIKNNVIGTYKTAFAALQYGVRRFVLISTDKAVNPTNIMGASKRLCEMVIQSMDAISKSKSYAQLPKLHAHQAADEAPNILGGTQFVAVRFGNVLGSNGSVLHRFQQQISDGGPVTVTHPDIIRYFMTIPEAVSLVLQAGGYAHGGEIFVLDMGEPVKIDTLARNMIRLSGYQPDEDIRIVYSGLRPGEKLYEEKLMAEEGIQKTANDMIFIGKPIPFEIPCFLQQLETLAAACYENDAQIVQLVERMVSTFHPVGETPA